MCCAPAGLEPVADREVPAPGGGADVLHHGRHGSLRRRPAAAMAANEHGSVLRPETLATMFQPHFQPDPRVPGMGLGFELGEEDGHRTVGKTGIVSGFHSAMTIGSR